MSDYSGRGSAALPATASGSNANMDAGDAASRDDAQSWIGGPGPPDSCSADGRASAKAPNLVEKGLETRVMRAKTQIKATIQSRVYNFLERPTGWKCFVYHFTV